MTDGLVRVWEMVWQMSTTGGFVCLIVCLLRLLLKKAPKVFSYALWGLVFIRLICPMVLSSPVSVVPSRQQWQMWSKMIVENYGDENVEIPPIHTGQHESHEQGTTLTGTEIANGSTRPGQAEQQFSGMTNGNMADRYEQNRTHAGVGKDTMTEKLPTQVGKADKSPFLSLTATVWLLGMATVLIGQSIRSFQWKRSLGQIQSIEEGVYTASGAAAPFVMGLVHPAIYLPEQMMAEEMGYVLLHERTHLRRKDYLIKMAAFWICCIHWFNPFAWLAFRLMCMDMEMSCDEAVLQQMNGQQKKAYATALLSFADRTVNGGSLAFGEPYAKKRIRNVLQYRRPAYRWMLVMTVICVALAGCLLTDPMESGSQTENGSWEQESTEDQQGDSEQPGMSESETQQGDGEKETSENDLYFAQLDAYEKSFRIGSKSPQITDKSASWYADLDHDGEDERLVFDWGYMEPGSFGIFAVLNTQGEVVYVDTPASAHAGWVNYYLCQWNGRDYLLEYQPDIGTGMGEYSYALLELNGDDRSQAKDQNSLWNVVDQQFVIFHVGPGDYIKEYDKDWEMDIYAMVDFAYMLNLYMEKSYLLVSTDEGWLEEEIRSSENGMFVLGSPEEPHRQYENYSLFTSQERPTQKKPSMDDVRKILENWCKKEGIPQVDEEAKYEDELQVLLDYIDSYQVGSTSPQITADSISWEADLTHDGQMEQVIFDWSQFDGGGSGMFAVLDAQGKVLFSDEVTSSHSWLRTYYLCSWKGKEYLFRYDPYMMQEEGSYWYELFYLTADGDKIIEDTESIGFSIAVLPSAPNDDGKRVMDIPAMVAFADKVNEYIQNSFLLVSSDWDWISELDIVPRKEFVIGSPQEPYRLQETYDWFNKEDLFGLDLSTITDVGEKIKIWCEAAKIPYIE